MEYSRAGGKLIHEKNQKKKYRDTIPLIGHLMIVFPTNLFGLS